MTDVEVLERAISKLETLRDEACGLPWTSTDQSPSMDGRNWVIRTEGEAGMKITAHDYGHYRNVELVVALSRTVEPIIQMHRRSLMSMKRAIGSGMSEVDVETIAEMSGELALARAILGEENDHA